MHAVGGQGLGCVKVVAVEMPSVLVLLLLPPGVYHRPRRMWFSAGVWCVYNQKDMGVLRPCWLGFTSRRQSCAGVVLCFVRLPGDGVAASMYDGLYS